MMIHNSLNLRPAEEVMRPERLGAMWGSRLSFMRRTIAHMFDNKWHVSIMANHLDNEGCGELIYHIATHERDLYYVVFSNNIPDAEREDRVIADRWDAATALVEGEITPERMEALRAGVPRQEYGRAVPGTLVWSRGNRSSRFFNYVVDRLSQGEQPDVSYLAQGGYILRSTAYYANAKFGLSTYDTVEATHALSGAYTAQMVAAFMFREFSVDLAEHLARCKNETGWVNLDPSIRRFIGIGNATGMGLVPYVINNPHVIHSWVYARESVLAMVKGTHTNRLDPQIDAFKESLERCITYFEEDPTERKGLFTAPQTLIQDLQRLLALTIEFQTENTLFSQPTNNLWASMAEFAQAECDIECQELLHSLMIDLYPKLCREAAKGIDLAMLKKPQPEMQLDELIMLIESRYQWALDLDLSGAEANKYFWYFSADSEEPLMGERGHDFGEHVERPLNIPFRVQALKQAIDETQTNETVGRFLLRHPEHRLIVDRIQAIAHLKYAEVHTNLMDADVIPLYTQRFQLAQYGMERFNPQSIYWVRVTLLQGAPIATDLGSDEIPDWQGFSLVPESV